MGKINRYITIVITLLSIVILLGIQVYWLLYSYKIEEALFSKSVRVALNQSIAELSKNEGLCQSMQKSIACDSSFRASRNMTPQVWKNLDQQVRSDLEHLGIDLAYEMAIFKGKDTLKINNLDKLVGSFCYRLSLEKALEMSDTEIGVIFPNRYNFFIHRMGVMFIGSVFLILMIGLSFILMLKYYLAEVRLSFNIKEMVNNLAHEFRTPISSISLAAKMIGQADEISKNPKLQRYTQTILDENKRLKNQSDHILQLAALEQNYLDYKFETINLTTIIDESSKSVSLLVEQKGGTIIKKYESEDYVVYGDRKELNHVFTNLMINALKYSEGAVTITVSVKSTLNELIVEVQDTGIGIARKDKNKIFEKYYRVSSGDRHNIKGFGLGLFYVKEVLKAHNATVDVESELGKGSIFILKFPKIQK